MVAYDKIADFKEGRYYACIFERAATIGMSGLQSRPKLLFKGVHQIKALLSSLSRDVGNMIAADLRTSQMGDGEWRASRDFTTKPFNGDARAGPSNGLNSRFGTRLAQMVKNEEMPPAYKK